MSAVFQETISGCGTGAVGFPVAPARPAGQNAGMDDELERLRAVVRALVAESQAWAAYTGHIIDRMAKGPPPAEAGDQEAYRLGLAANGRQWDLEQAVARLAEVNAELVAGYESKWKEPPPL